MRRAVAPLLILLAFCARADLREVRSFDEIQQAFRPDARVRVVSVWATWCAPCVAEIGGFNDIAKGFGKGGVEIVGVSLDDAVANDRAKAKAQLARFLADRKIVFRNVYYTGKTNELADELHFDGAIPVTIVFDRQGREIARGEGVLDMKWFRDTLKMLEEKTR
jgi:peroxiredoxin